MRRCSGREKEPSGRRDLGVGGGAAPSGSHNRAPLGVRTFPGPGGAGIAAPRWGSVPAWLPFPGLPKVTGTRTVGHQAAVPGRGLGAADPLPQISAQARNGRAGAHNAPPPPDPGRGAPWGRVGGAAPGSPAPPRGPRRFRLPRGRPGSQDEPPGLCVASKSPLSIPHCHDSVFSPPKAGVEGEATIHRVGRSPHPTSSWETEARRRGRPKIVPRAASRVGNLESGNGGPSGPSCCIT